MQSINEGAIGSYAPNRLAVGGGGGGGGVVGMHPQSVISGQNEVQRESEYLTNAQGELSDLLQILHTRLAAFMRPDNTEKTGGDPRPETNTTFGQFLAGQASRARRDISLVQSILGRLEI